MELQKALEKLEKNDTYTSWKKQHTDAFLSYCLMTIEKDIKSSWQIGFYQKSGKITTFVIDSTIKQENEEDVFKKPGNVIEPINKDLLKLSFDEINGHAISFQKEKYPQELVNKTIVILQNLESLGTVWNITFITLAFKTLNLKISPDTGKVLAHSLTSIMDLIQK